ncbi:MAG: hypothetical protein ACOC22_01000 [bacterium]
MTIFRTYFKKNNTLIENNFTNNSQNPVTEISYGTLNKEVTRFIFDIDLEPLKTRIQQGIINPDNISKHVLRLTNTIRYASEYIGKKSYSLDIERASSFNLELFNISEDWDEGSGYDFSYNNQIFPILTQQASNWYYRKNDTPWAISGGSYQSGVTEIFGVQRFEKGNEDIEIDITDYVNGRLNYSGLTGYTGTTFGLGLKFTDDFEALETLYRQAVAFETKSTHTFFEPHVETIIDDTIKDDRNYFFMDKDNDLFLYVNVGNNPEDIIINSVEIYDYEDLLYTTISGNAITKVKKGVYKITLNISSDEYLDAVIFRDVWNVTINDKDKIIENQFYLISSENYTNFDLSNQIDFDNYAFYFWGIKHNEHLIAGDIRNIKLTLRELYPNQDNYLPLDIEYRIYITVGSEYEINVIPFTSVNRTCKGFEFNLDTSWFIPQDYYLEIRMKNGSYYESKERIKFTVASNKLK